MGQTLITCAKPRLQHPANVPTALSPFSSLYVITDTPPGPHFDSVVFFPHHQRVKLQYATKILRKILSH